VYVPFFTVTNGPASLKPIKDVAARKWMN